MFVLADFCGNFNVRPMLGLSAVFFWLFNRPDIFNLFSVALIGFFCDIFSAVPPGTYLIAFLAVYIMEIKIAGFISNKLFVINFASFALISLAAILIEWTIVSIYYQKALPFAVNFFDWLLTICLYPLVAFINLKIASLFLHEEEDFLDE